MHNMKMSGKLISVIIPCYNQGEFLTEAVESILKQTYQNFEIIIINDGSSDQTHTISNQLKNKDQRIKYFFQKNMGLPVARNQGLSLAKGDYIQFLDADDTLASDKFTKQLTIFHTYQELDICYSNFQNFESATGKLKGRMTEVKMTLAIPLDDFLYRWERGFTLPIHTALIKKSAFENSKPFNETFKAKEDWLMWIDLALNHKKFYFLDEDLAWYRINPHSMVRNTAKMAYYYAQATFLIAQKLPNRAKKDKFMQLAYEHFVTQYAGNILIQPPIIAVCCFNDGRGKIEKIPTLDKNFYIADFNFEIKVKNLIFQPVSGQYCRFKFHEIIVNRVDTKNTYTWYDIGNRIQSNGVINDKDWLDFVTPYPQIILPLTGKIKSLQIKGEIEIITSEQLLKKLDGEIDLLKKEKDFWQKGKKDLIKKICWQVIDYSHQGFKKVKKKIIQFLRA